jgi:hypothetical protein
MFPPLESTVCKTDYFSYFFSSSSLFFSLPISKNKMTKKLNKPAEQVPHLYALTLADDGSPAQDKTVSLCNSVMQLSLGARITKTRPSIYVFPYPKAKSSFELSSIPVRLLRVVDPLCIQIIPLKGK